MRKRVVSWLLAGSALAALTVTLSVTSVPRARAASKEIQELQRDVAQLQDQLKQLQQSQDRQLAEIRVLVQQSLAAANDANKAVAVIQSGFQQNLKDQQTQVVAPVVGIGTRMDQMSSDLRTVQQSVTDLTSMIGKLQAQLTDLGNAVKVMSAPAPPPPSGGSAETPAGGGAGAPGGGSVPTISANDLYTNASRDRTTGKLDLALQEFTDYLRWYGNTELAPNAQYYIAWIHASQGDNETAVREYDMVLEKYPDNPKTADALFGKGEALLKLGRRTEGAREFQELIKRFPKNDLAPRACDRLKSLGYNCGSARAAAPAKSASKRKK